MDKRADCALCNETGGTVLWNDKLCRVVLVDEPDYPGFCRVILNQHVKEMTDLPAALRLRLFEVVMAVEGVVRQVLSPDKINLASLGNVVPHVHWHVIPRHLDDAHFPAPVWAEAKRAAPSRSVPVNLDELLKRALERVLS